MKALFAGVPPLFVYVSTASEYAHWFDGGEFVAAVADFGISHPPGHPLAAIVLGAANLAPSRMVSLGSEVEDRPSNSGSCADSLGGIP